MTVESTFFLFGSIFFVTWFIFLVVLTVLIVWMTKKTREMQEEILDQLESRKSNWLMTVIPLIPSIMQAGKKVMKNKY